MNPAQPYPTAFSHIGLTVPDIEAAVQFYTTVMVSFPQGVKQAPAFQPFNTGLFHFCVQDPDIEGLVARIVAAGGKQRMPIRAYYPAEKPCRMCYVEDPFGIVFEVYTHSYELTYSSGVYTG